MTETPAAMGWKPRVAASLGAFGLGLALAVAACVEPDPSGTGTHRRLGLPACRFLEATGRRCPGCGLTTSVAATVRGRFDLAWRANPTGIAITACAGIAAVWLGASAWRGGPLGFRTFEVPTVVVVAGLCLLATLVWMTRWFAP